MAEGDLFALQLGSFLDPKNARQLQAELKDRGYNSSIVTALDSEQREWHVVRMGSYKTLESAAQAAADFSGKERINALVRHANTL
jgi:cell division protein FtsN